MKEGVRLLIDIANSPEKYYWVVNVPGKIDAALHLYTYHWDELPAKTARKIEKILVEARILQWNK